MKKTPSEALHEFLEAIGIGRLCHWLAPRIPVSRLDCLNRFFLQWFFIRLERVTDTSTCFSISQMMKADFTWETTKGEHKLTFRWWAIRIGVWPLSGYDRPYKYTWWMFRFRVSKVIDDGKKYNPRDLFAYSFSQDIEIGIKPLPSNPDAIMEVYKQDGQP